VSNGVFRDDGSPFVAAAPPADTLVTDFLAKPSLPGTCWVLRSLYFSSTVSGAVRIFFAPGNGAALDEVIELVNDTGTQFARFCYPIPYDASSRVPWTLRVDAAGSGDVRIRYAFDSNIEGAR